MAIEKDNTMNIIIMLLTLFSFNIQEVHIEYEVTGYIPIGETYTRVGITDYPIYKTTQDSSFVYKGITHVIPKGFHTDLATIPHWFWGIVEPMDFDQAAIIHDWIYDHPQSGITHFEADQILKGLMKEADKGQYASTLSYIQRALSKVLPQRKYY